MNDHIFDKAAWAKLSMFEQMGNIGSEVGRALSAKKRGKADWMMGSFYRGLDLIDHTAELWARDKSPRVRELLRARKLFAESILGDNVDSTLEQYFMNFAYSARLAATSNSNK